ncbi:MAG: VOC family protein [Armatimonas sp.]
MQIHHVEVVGRDRGAMRRFYSETLGLEIIDESNEGFSVQAGASELTFTNTPAPAGVYHIAFNIPEDRFDEGVEWLKERAEILWRPDGREVFTFDNWNAHAVYFEDPDGNILELITRHSLPSASTQFEILSISEVGVAVDDVAAEAERLGLPDYKQNSAEFRPVGDEEGLLILVKSGRLWWPTEDRPALPLPTELTLSTGQVRYPR